MTTAVTTYAPVRIALRKSEPEVTPAQWHVIDGIHVSSSAFELLRLVHWGLNGDDVIARGISTYVWHTYSKLHHFTLEVGKPRPGAYMVNATPEEDARKAVDVWRRAVHKIKRRQLLTEPQIDELDKCMVAAVPVNDDAPIIMPDGVKAATTTTTSTDHSAEDTLMRIACKKLVGKCHGDVHRIFATVLACGYRNSSSDDQAKLLRAIESCL